MPLLLLLLAVGVYLFLWADDNLDPRLPLAAGPKRGARLLALRGLRGRGAGA